METVMTTHSKPCIVDPRTLIQNIKRVEEGLKDLNMDAKDVLLQMLKEEYVEQHRESRRRSAELGISLARHYLAEMQTEMPNQAASAGGIMTFLVIIASSVRDDESAAVCITSIMMALKHIAEKD
jgi:hypothetical protein